MARYWWLGVAVAGALVTTSVAAQRAETPRASTWGQANTAHTTRISASSPYEQAVAVTQILYPATNGESRPHAVIIARPDQQAIAMLAVSRLTHFPTNAPLLFADRDNVPTATLGELKRLKPDGSTYDANTQIYLVGEFTSRVEAQLREVVKPHESLVGGIRRFPTNDPIQLAEDLDAWSTRVHGTPPQSTVILQLRQLATGLPSVYWNAHMGHAVFFVDGGTIPEPTRRALSRRWDNTAFMYLMGGEAIISNQVQRDLQRYGLVRRVPGDDPYEIASTFAGYRDAGRTTRFGIGTRPRDFGWGIATAGRNFTFADPADWHAAVPGAVLAHLGKHGPLLLVRRDGVPAPVSNYLNMVKPTVTDPAGQLYNHGWILGGLDPTTQRSIDSALTPRLLLRQTALQPR